MRLEQASDVLMWSASEGGGRVCVRIGIGPVEFELWLSPEQSIELATDMLRRAAEAVSRRELEGLP